MYIIFEYGDIIVDVGFIVFGFVIGEVVFGGFSGFFEDVVIVFVIIINIGDVDGVEVV